MSRSDIIEEIERIYDESEVNGVVDTMEFGKKCYDQATRKTLLQTTKECAENTLSKIKSKEKHGIIIIDVKKVDDAMVERALNPSKQQEKEIEEEQLEIKLKTHAISIRNQLCQDLINELKLNQTIEFCKKELER